MDEAGGEVEPADLDFVLEGGPEFLGRFRLLEELAVVVARWASSAAPRLALLAGGSAAGRAENDQDGRSRADEEQARRCPQVGSHGEPGASEGVADNVICMMTHPRRLYVTG